MVDWLILIGIVAAVAALIVVALRILGVVVKALKQRIEVAIENDLARREAENNDWRKETNWRVGVVEFVLLFIGMIAALGLARAEIVGAHEMKALKWAFLWGPLLVIFVTSLLQRRGILGGEAARYLSAAFGGFFLMGAFHVLSVDYSL